MTRNGITCVEWTEPVSVRWAMSEIYRCHRSHRPQGYASDFGKPPYVYLVTGDDGPLYVGCTRNSVGARLSQHRAAGRPFGLMLRRAAVGECRLDVRWTEGGPDLEAQVIWATQPAYNNRSRIVPNFPLRVSEEAKRAARARMDAVAELRRAGAFLPQIREQLGISEHSVYENLRVLAREYPREVGVFLHWKAA